METNGKKGHLRLVIGGRAAESNKKQVMTEIGLLDEQDLAVWQLIRKAPASAGNWLGEQGLAEEAQVQALLTERLRFLREAFPEMNIDAENLSGLPEELRMVLLVPPLALAADGKIMMLD